MDVSTSLPALRAVNRSRNTDDARDDDAMREVRPGAGCSYQRRPSPASVIYRHQFTRLHRLRASLAALRSTINSNSS